LAAGQFFSDLWSELVIDESGCPIAKSDKETKDSFVKDCVLVLDVHEDSTDSVGKVVNKMCSKAGGKGAECTDMTKTLWEAHKDKKLKPWCEKTFAWFASKTKPRCLSNCKALLCKSRCKVDDQLADMSDEISAYGIKMDTIAAREKRSDKATAYLKAALAKVDKEDKTKCTPAREEVKKLTASEQSIGKELGSLIKASAKAGDQKDKDFAALNKLSSDKKAKAADKDKAGKAYEKSSAVFIDAKKKQAAKNKELKEMRGKLKQASSKKTFNCKALKDMKAEYDGDKKAHDSDVKTLATDKKKIKDAMDKVVADKKKLGGLLASTLKAM